MEELLHPQVGVFEFAFVVVPFFRRDLFDCAPDQTPVTGAVVTLQSVTLVSKREVPLSR